MSAKQNRKRRTARRSQAARATFRPKSEPLENRLLLASDWTNPIDVYNVDASNTAEAVAPLDALLVINELNVSTVRDPLTGALPDLTEIDADPTVYFDVSGDGFVSPLDALMVINKLNTNAVVVENTGQHAAANVIVGTQAALAGGVSNDTLVNTQTKYAQHFPDVASTALGASVVVWQSVVQDGSGWGIYGQRFDATGAAVGEEFQVNTTTRGSQTAPAVAISDSGAFVVVWHSVFGADGRGFGVYAQEYDSSGARVGEEVLVNATTKGMQAHADVAFSGDDYTVVWQGRGSGDVNGIFARTFSGGTAGAEILVNTTTRGYQGNPSVGANAAGNVVVVWEGKGAGDHYGVFMRDISTDGDAVLVNATTSGLQRTPSVAVGSDGGVVVAWHNPPNGIWARSFTGGTGGDVIQVNQTDPGIQSRPDVAALVGGGFVVAWQGKGNGDNHGSFVRTFGSDGVATSEETLANQTTRAAQVRPSIAAANEGYIVAWQGRGEGDRHGAFARFFETGITGPFAINAIADGTVAEGATFTATASVTDTDNSGDDNPVFSLMTAPTGATINASTGAISWATSESDGPGTFEFTVVATEGEFTSSDTFMITVSEVNVSPVLAQISNVTALVDNAANFTVSATDADLPAQTLTYSAAGNPSWLSFNAATRTFSGTPATADVGSSTVTVTVSDGAAGTASQTFTVTVTGNQAPTVTTAIADTVLGDGDALNLNVSGNFSDPDGDTLTYSAASLPSWASLNGTTGVLTGTPAAADEGTTTVTITAMDANGGSVSDTFDLTFDINNQSPSVLEGSFRVVPTAAAGASVGTVFAQDLDPTSTLTYSITAGNDAGAFAINATTGEITVANATALASLSGDVGLTVQATDGTTTAATGPVTVTVSATGAFALYSLQVVDPSNGNAVLTSVTAGQTVDLVMSVQGAGQGSQGIFSAFADIVYNPGTVTLAGNVVHDPTYNVGAFADVSVPGLINEAGGSDGTTPLGSGVEEVLRVPVTIGNLPAGTTVAFATNFSDAGTIRATTIFGSNFELTSAQQGFSGASVTVASSQAAASAAVDAVFAGDDDEDE